MLLRAGSVQAEHLTIERCKVEPVTFGSAESSDLNGVLGVRRDLRKRDDEVPVERGGDSSEGVDSVA